MSAPRLPILEKTLRARQRMIHRYIDTHKVMYQEFARFITPDEHNYHAVWDRVAFAILSANAPFEASVKALHYARAHGTHSRYVGGFDQFAGMVPAKLDYIQAIPNDDSLIRGQAEDGTTESWLAYRVRLAKKIKGLGWTKASFAASLIYPLESDLACIDTHVQKVYLGHSKWQRISQETYLLVEARVRKIAHTYGINTFLAQWMIWDCARGQGPNNHAIFPGSHKTESELWREW
mgnify:CR=1 FL=1